ncbi:MAG: DUF2752 domain-containing protein [Planctomicrobium sp.]|jgi:hypothetical protein|nr:DUF2752 domain-containing protein [Planctomicrobium sp.]
MTLNTATYYKLTFRDRCLLVAGCVCVIAGFIIGSTVDPDPRGFGTHQQFGLPPCRFREVLGISCPSCGGTTSVAHFVRAQWVESAKANTAVFSLALIGLLSIPWFLFSLWKGYLLGIEYPSKLFVTLTLSLTGIAVLQWVWRLYF